MKVILKRATLSFPVLNEPESFQGGQAKYKATFVVTDEDQKKELLKAVAAVGKEKFGEQFAERIRKGKLNNPIKKSDPEENPGYPEGSIYIRTSSKDQPGMVAVWRGSDGKPARVGADQFYPGAIVNASVFCSAFDMEANKGVTFYLNNIQFVEDGERLDNRIDAADEFEVDESAEAPLEDLEDDEDEDANEDEEEEEEEPAPKKRKKAKKATEDDLSDLMA